MKMSDLAVKIFTHQLSYVFLKKLNSCYENLHQNR